MIINFGNLSMSYPNLLFFFFKGSGFFLIALGFRVFVYHVAVIVSFLFFAYKCCHCFQFCTLQLQMLPSFSPFCLQLLALLSPFFLYLLLSWCGTFVPRLPWLCLHLPFKDQTIQCYSNLLSVILNCVFIFFGIFNFFACIQVIILFPPFCLELLLSWHGCVLALPLSCLDLALKDWTARCYFGLLHTSHCVTVLFYFQMFIVDLFFFCNFQPSSPFL